MYGTVVSRDVTPFSLIHKALTSSLSSSHGFTLISLPTTLGTDSQSICHQAHAHFYHRSQSPQVGKPHGHHHPGHQYRHMHHMHLSHAYDENTKDFYSSYKQLEKKHDRNNIYRDSLKLRTDG